MRGSTKVPNDGAKTTKNGRCLESLANKLSIYLDRNKDKLLLKPHKKIYHSPHPQKINRKKKKERRGGCVICRYSGIYNVGLRTDSWIKKKKAARAWNTG